MPGIASTAGPRLVAVNSSNPSPVFHIQREGLDVEIDTSYPLPEATLYPRPHAVLGFELGGLLAVASSLERHMMVCWQSDGALP
jgi:hypothetical protein